MKTALIIPVYNEGERLRHLLNRTLQYFPPADTVIVDDGSTDRCAEGLDSEGFKLIRHLTNQGKGAALISGFKLAQLEGFEWALTMDADGQHDPEAVPAFIAAAATGTYDLVIGHRRQERAKMPWDRRFSNFTTSLALSIVSGQKIRDAQCGYRMYRLDFVRNLNLKTSAFDTENELLLEAFRQKRKIGWVEIPIIYTDAPSHIRRWQDTKKFLILLTKYIFSRKT